MPSSQAGPIIVSVILAGDLGEAGGEMMNHDVNELAALVNSPRDVTDRKRSEEQARRLEQMQSRRRQALELNDEIVQGLTVAQFAHALGQHSKAGEAIERTLHAAQAIITEMLAEQKAEGPLADGDLRRERPVGVPRREQES